MLTNRQHDRGRPTFGCQAWSRDVSLCRKRSRRLLWVIVVKRKVIVMRLPGRNAHNRKRLHRGSRHMSDWMHDPEVVQAAAAFRRARQSWQAIAGPDERLYEEMTFEQQTAFEHMKRADHEYVWARDGALQRHRLGGFIQGGPHDGRHRENLPRVTPI